MTEGSLAFFKCKHRVEANDQNAAPLRYGEISWKPNEHNEDRFWR